MDPWYDKHYQWFVKYFVIKWLKTFWVWSILNYLLQRSYGITVNLSHVFLPQMTTRNIHVTTYARYRSKRNRIVWCLPVVIVIKFNTRVPLGFWVVNILILGVMYLKQPPGYGTWERIRSDQKFEIGQCRKMVCQIN